MTAKRVVPAALTTNSKLVLNGGKVVPVTEVKIVTNEARGVYFPGQKFDMDRVIAVHITYYVDLTTSYTFVRTPDHTVLVAA